MTLPARTARDAIRRIERLYFRTTEGTVERDVTQAVELFKTLPDDRSRQQAAVYMDGLSQMRSEWRLAERKPDRARKGRRRK